MNDVGILYLSGRDIESLDLGVGNIVVVIEDVLREKYFKRVEMPPKPGIHPEEDAFIHAMPAYVPKIAAAGIKWIAGYPHNPMKGLPYITGLLVLNDPKTGLPVCIMDACWITAKRTGAVTAISAKHLARGGPEVVGVIGCGVQGKSNLEALASMFDTIRKVKAYDVVEGRLRQYVEYVGESYGLEVVCAKAPREAVEGSDIIVTATPILKNPSPVAQFRWVKEGALVCPIEFDSYWDSDTFSGPDKLYTDDVQQLEYYKTVGHFSDVKKIHGELSELVVGVKEGRVSDKEKITVVNLGLALADVAVAKTIYDIAVKRNVGTVLPY
ncbi:MAG: ornithine cyclodeaminase family protein [Nitrososphaeria archaeon]